MRLLISRHLENFLALCEAQSMHAAAERKGITQPALTKSLKTLEDEIGTELFIRTSKGIERTAAGEVLYRHARAIDQGARFAELDVHQIVNTAEGRLRLGVGPGLAASSLPQVMVGFYRQFPDVQVTVEVGITNHLVANLLRDNLDVIATARPVRDLPEHFSSIRLTEIGMAIICRSTHPLAGNGVVNGGMLSAYDCVTFMEDQALIGRTLKTFGTKHGSFRIAAETNSVSFMLDLLAVTDYFSLVGANIVSRALQEGLVSLAFDEPLWSIEIDLMCKRTLVNSRPIQTLLGLWREQLDG